MMTEYNLMIVLDLECQKSADVLNIASEIRMFNKKVEWILFGSRLNDSLSLVTDQNINIDAKILLVVKNQEEFQFYHIRCPALNRNGLMFVNSMGNYSEERQLPNRLMYNNPFNFVNYTLHATILRIAICVSF